MEEGIVNRVANSKLLVFDLEDYYLPGTRSVIDLKSWLEHELILREKDFRAQVKAYDWSQYQDHYIAITCSNDAIIADWAFMLVTTMLQPYAKKIVFGSLENLETSLYQDIINTIDTSPYVDKPVIIKGCSKKPVPSSAYIMATNKLQPIAKSIMFGEACSTVPLYKQTKKS